MKKILSLVAVLVTVLALAACSVSEDNETGTTPGEGEVIEVVVEEVELDKILVDSENGKIWFTYEDTTELTVGDVIEVTYTEPLAESDPMQGKMDSYVMVEKYVAPALDYTASEILNKIINGSNVEMYGMEDVITADNQQWLLGAGDYPEFLDAAVYYPMMGIDVSMLVVLEVNPEDVELTKETIMTSIDPNRLVCVTFDLEEDVVVDSFGNHVVLVINKAFKTELHDAFLSLVEEAELGQSSFEATVLELNDGEVVLEKEDGQVGFTTEKDISELVVGDLIKVIYEKNSNKFVGYEMIQKYTAPSFDLSASEIVQNLVNESGVELRGMEDVITSDNQQWFLGAGDYPEFIDSAVFTPMMNVDVSLIVVMKVELEQVEDLKTTILDSIDPQRLICVSFDLETDVVIDSYGDTVVLIINKQFTEEIHNAFLALQ